MYSVGEAVGNKKKSKRPRENIYVVYLRFTYVKIDQPNIKMEIRFGNYDQSINTFQNTSNHRFKKLNNPKQDKDTLQ